MSGPEIVALVDEGLGNCSYLADLGDGSALVVDPARHPGSYLAEADKRGLRIAHVAETHLHADFVSGSRELAAHGSRVVAARAAGLGHPHHGLVGGERLDVGDLAIEALATPGHTPEHLAYLLLDGSRPVALFSGGSLLVGAVARTDLISPEQTEELARSLWRSIQEELLSLPDELAVYPTHGAGSFCSVAPGAERVTTIGRERSSNPLLACADEDAFVARLLAGFGTFPPYFLELREVNRRGPRVYGQWPVLGPLSARDVRRHVDDGAKVVDVRQVESFATGHIPGPLSIPLRPQFASWLGWLVGRDRSIVFVVDDDQDRRELVRQCLAIGYEHLAGELAGGIEAWKSADLPVTGVALVAAEDAFGTLVDVRQHNEYTSGHVLDAINVELGDMAEQSSTLTVDRGRHGAARCRPRTGGGSLGIRSLGSRGRADRRGHRPGVPDAHRGSRRCGPPDVAGDGRRRLPALARHRLRRRCTSRRGRGGPVRSPGRGDGGRRVECDLGDGGRCPDDGNRKRDTVVKGWRTRSNLVELRKMGLPLIWKTDVRFWLVYGGYARKLFVPFRSGRLRSTLERFGWSVTDAPPLSPPSGLAERVRRRG